MASGDTKTEALLNILGNGGDASEYRGCCNTKTQGYILDAIDRVQNVEDEVEELKNNPDVVDIVDTYADLQAYDTQHLTDNDIIRVLQDETHSGNSTYYRFTKNPDTWTFVGEISGGGGGGSSYKILTEADYNWNSVNKSTTGTLDSIAPWLLDDGIYYVDNTVYVAEGHNLNKSTNSVYANRSFIVFKNPNVDGISTGILLYSPNRSFVNPLFLPYAYNGTLQVGTADQGLLLNRSDIQNNLTSTSANRVLSASQGKVLKDLIDALDARVSALEGN